MRVFISWSGETSEKVAKELRDWIPSVLQSVKPYFTPSDIDKGARWSTEIFNELESSSFGILTLTKENLEKPWILFEAGALIAKLGAKVCPLLVGASKADVKGPLAHFQATIFQKDDFKKLMAELNRDLGQGGVAADVFDKIFEKWWPDLDTSVTKALESPAHPPKPRARSDREILEEVLLSVRELQHNRGESYRSLLTSTGYAMADLYCELASAAPSDGDSETYIELLLSIGDGLKHICERRMGPSAVKQFREKFATARLALEKAKEEIPFL